MTETIKTRSKSGRKSIKPITAPSTIPRRNIRHRNPSSRLMKHRRRRSACPDPATTEYERLKVMVPSVAKKDKVSKVQLIEETVKFIDHLHVALLKRFQKQGFKVADNIDNSSQPINRSRLRDLVWQTALNNRMDNPLERNSESSTSTLEDNAK